MLWLHEEILPFYQGLRAQWQQLVNQWEQGDRELRQAAASPELATWPEQLEAVLAKSGGPWTGDRVEALYREAFANDRLLLNPNPEVEAPTMCRGVAAQLKAEEWLKRLTEHAAALIAPTLTIPIDIALMRHTMDLPSLSDWLAALVNQAQPFWPYDEAVLDEANRSQAMLKTWLFVPQGSSSPLAELVQSWPEAPTILTSQQPEALVVVTVRRGINLS
jgi:hypothetical protein